MYSMISFLPFITWAKKVMKIVAYQETKMLLFCHHTSLVGAAVLPLWDVCLLNLSHSLWIDGMERLWWNSAFYLLWFSVPTFLFVYFFHFNAVFWLYGNMVINLQSEPLNIFLCDCASVMICVVGIVNFSPFSE